MGAMTNPQLAEIRARLDAAESAPIPLITHAPADIAALLEEVDRLRAENRSVLTSREGWAARSREQFDRIGKALYPIRKKRWTGEPARDDATEIESIVAEVEVLKHQERVFHNTIENRQKLEAQWAEAYVENERLRAEVDALRWTSRDEEDPPQTGDWVEFWNESNIPCAMQLWCYDEGARRWICGDDRDDDAVEVPRRFTHWRRVTGPHYTKFQIGDDDRETTTP